LLEISVTKVSTTSQFYTQVPTIGAKRKGSSSAQHQKDTRNDKKAKTAFDMRGLQKEVPTVSKPLTKKERQQAVKAARRAEREEAAAAATAAAAAAAEGSVGPSIETPASEPMGDFGL
jgi:hypothetical protein